MICSIPLAAASSTMYWMMGLSTIGSISLGWALVAGKKRVPRPAAGKTALRTRLFVISPAAQPQNRMFTAAAIIDTRRHGTRRLLFQLYVRRKLGRRLQRDLGMLEMKVGGVLVGLGCGEHLGVAEQVADERDARRRIVGRMQAIRQNYRRVAGQIRVNQLA